MKTREFLNKLDDQRILAAIALTEKSTSGEVRLFISEQPAEDPMQQAEKEFLRLGMEKTAARNAALIFVAPASQTFAIIGLHQQCGQAFWDEISAEMKDCFIKDNLTEAIAQTILRLGDALSRYFPSRRGDRNELPNDIARG
jgi:uncharacterized membrane protein